MLSKSREGQFGLDGIIRGVRQSGIGFVDPGPEIPVDKEIEAKERHQVREAQGQAAAQLQVVRSRMAIHALQIWKCTAEEAEGNSGGRRADEPLALVPTKVLILRFCLSAFKKSSICQRFLVSGKTREGTPTSRMGHQ